jgi:plastocyanin
MIGLAKSNVVVITVAFIFVLGLNNVDVVSSSSAVNTRVAAGGDGAAWDTYSPQNITINQGDSVTWHNPSSVAEPHTITFLTNPTFFPPLAAPFSIPNDTNIESAIPDPNVEPIILPPSPTNANGSKTVIMDNARAYLPVVVDSGAENVTYLPPNSNYTQSGTEAYVNSGFLFPQGLSPPGFPAIEEFTVTFENPGTYNYVCVLHPWMTGSVTVN